MGAPPPTTRESVEFDVLFVGAGPASLAGAIHLKRLLQAAQSNATVAIIEKAPELGSHTLSGAVLNPRALKELWPDFLERGAPIETPVREDALMIMTSKRAWRAPWVPPPLENHGNYIVTLSKLVRWMGGEAQAAGVEVFLGFPGQEVLWEGDRVVGVKAGEKGVDKAGRPKANYEAGVDIRAKVVVFGEGTHGSLTKHVIAKRDLRKGRHPQKYSTGVKELWEVPADRHREGAVTHTLGYPADWWTFGGGFIYHLPNRRVALGWVVGLDYRRPELDPHAEMQKFKAHPFVARLLRGGKLIGYGAKTLPEGGYFSLPRYFGDGFLLIGDSAGFLDSQRLKGVHLAMKSGMLAAEAIADALARGDVSAASLQRFEALVESSWIKEELWKVRNFHQGFRYGMGPALGLAGLGLLTGGWALSNRLPAEPDHESLRPGGGAPAPAPAFDDLLTFRKLSSVFYSGTRHEEDQPCHLVITPEDLATICQDRCAKEYGNPCQHFCPAGVYEMAEGALRINFANCVHCKTCDIKDPYQVINWVTPQGGDGPQYYGL